MASKRKPVVQATKSTRERTFSLTPAQFRYRWVKALESGKYKQGNGHLHKIINGAEGRVDEFCCLGVACDLYKRYGGSLSVHQEDDGDYIDVLYGKERENAELPEKVRAALGLNEGDGSFGDSSLARLNDSGEPFDRIAEIIKSKPEGLIAS